MTPQKIIPHYNLGLMPTGEATSKLVLAATEHDPASFAESMPEELLVALQEQSRQIPRPEEFFILRSVCENPPTDPEERAARDKAEKERYVTGLRTWKAYFDAQKTQG
jgi:hypothetical protein